jgi:hypothetical protein
MKLLFWIFLIFLGIITFPYSIIPGLLILILMAVRAKKGA